MMGNHPSSMEFRGPVHYDDLVPNEDLPQQIKDDFKEFSQLKALKKKKAGIYVFGFLTDHNGNFIPKKAVFNHTDHKFIPYYAGIDSNLHDFKRIREHRNLYSDETRHLIRFSMDHMRSFYLGTHGFPVSLNSRKGNEGYNQAVLEWISIPSNKGKVVYCNHYRSLIATYGQITADPDTVINDRSILPPGLDELGFAIDRVRVRKKPEHHLCSRIYDPVFDTLEYLYAGLNNFWLIYCPIDPELDSLEKKEKNSLLSELETAVYFALNGQTVSTVKDKIDLKKLCQVKITCPAAPYLFKKVEVFPKVLERIYPSGEMNNEWLMKVKTLSSIFPGY